MQVFCVAADPTGQWLASGGADCTLRLWDAATGRCTCCWKFEDAVRAVAWCPGLRILSVAAGRSVYLLPSGAGAFACGPMLCTQLAVSQGALPPGGACTVNPGHL